MPRAIKVAGLVGVLAVTAAACGSSGSASEPVRSTAASFAPQAGPWTERTPMPEGRAEVGVTELDGKVYVIGGTVQASGDPVWSSTLNTMYDPAADVWQQLAPLPSPLSHAGVAALDGKIYAIGGFLEPVHIGPQTAAYAYDPGTNAWITLPSLPDATGSLAVAGVDGKLHVMGGRTSSTVVPLDTGPGGPQLSAGLGTVSTHHIYDPETTLWTTASPVPGPTRDHMGIAVVDDRIHLFGGREEDVDENLTRHDVYEPDADSWSSAAPLPAPRSSGAYSVLAGRVLYAGGECEPGGDPTNTPAYVDMNSYDSASDTWTELESLPQPRHAFGAATVDGVVYFAGGAPMCGGGASTELFAFAPTND